jgi:hypothetical protein
MSILVKAYHRLLADLSHVSKVPFGAPDNIDEAWVLKEGPLLDKALLKYLETPEASLPQFPSWLLPLWEQFVLSKDPLLIRYIRQCLTFCYKAEQLPTNEQLEEAQASFENTDSDIAVWDFAFKQSISQHPIIRSARRIVHSVLHRIDYREITPMHGPGAVFPSKAPIHKSNFSTVYSTLQECYPYDQFFCGLPSFWKEIMVDGDRDLTSADRIQAKLVAVPKDSRGPRLICVHPCEAVWIQQGIRKKLESAIERSPLTAGRVNFTDQSINARLALAASLDQKYCTIDLKEASDRISLELVRHLFDDVKFLECCRAVDVKLLDGRVIVLKKFAPMGNAITFPIQSILFFSLVVAGLKHYYNVNCTDVYVFGDDIIVPSQYYEGAIKALVLSGLVPNASKCFVRGFFRESCGTDAYKGVDVTPLRMKVRDADSDSNAASLCDLAKRLKLQGYTACSSFLYSIVSKRYGSLGLTNNPDCQGIVEYVEYPYTHLITKLERFHIRWNRSLQRYETRTGLVRSCLATTPKYGWYHIQDSLLRISNDIPISDRGTEYSVPYRGRLICGWTELIRLN